MFKFPREVVVLQFHHVLHRSMEPLDLSLGHWMERRTSSMRDLMFLKVGPEFLRDVAWPIIRQQPGLQAYLHLIDTGSLSGEVQYFLHIPG